jgi:hypothetical protein
MVDGRVGAILFGERDIDHRTIASGTLLLAEFTDA